jgi:hypothetical protein
LTPGERKSVEPMAAVTAPHRTAAQHQSLLHFAGEGRWSDERVLAKVRQTVLPAIERHRPIEAWIIDDTGFPKKGKHSVGVARQYCGQLGKQDNCQVAVSLSLANADASLPVASRLYLPQAWANDAARRNKAGVPEEIGFQTKVEIALDQIRAANAAGLPRGAVLMDAGYGPIAICAPPSRRLACPMSPAFCRTPRCGRPTTCLRRDAEHQPVRVKDLAFSLPTGAWRTITWREGTNEPLKSCFARLRIRSNSKWAKMLLSSIFSMVCGWTRARIVAYRAAGQARAARDRPLAQSFGLEPQYLPDTTHRHSLGWHRLSPAATPGVADFPRIPHSDRQILPKRTQLPLDRLECYGVNVVLIFI